MSLTQYILVALLIACPLSALLGLWLAQWSIRRSFDRETEASLLRGLPMMLGLERSIRKTVVDRQCEGVKRRHGEAAYCDIHIFGREITVVGAKPQHLEFFATAVDQHREAIETVMRCEALGAAILPEQLKRMVPPHKFTPPVMTDGKVVEFKQET